MVWGLTLNSFPFFLQRRVAGKNCILTCWIPEILIHKVLFTFDLIWSFCFSSEAVARRCWRKLVFLKILQNSLENICVGVSFLLNLHRVQVCNFIKKETPAQEFSCVFYENYKNSVFYWTSPVAASVSSSHKQQLTILTKYDIFTRLSSIVHSF